LMQRQIKTPSMQPKQKTTSSSASMSDASFYGGDLAVASVMAQSAVNRKKQKQAAFAEHLRHNKRWIFFFFFACFYLLVSLSESLQDHPSVQEDWHECLASCPR
jgi:hypothetical protein